MSKDYQLLTNEPISEFDESVLHVLRELAATGCHPKSMCGVIQTEEGEVMTFYHNAAIQDMMLAKSQLELDIINDNILGNLGNLGYFIDQAEREGLLQFIDDEDEEEGNEDE